MWRKRRERLESPVYRDGMAQTNGDPIEDITDTGCGADTDAYPDMAATINHPAHYTYGSIEVIDAIEGLLLPYHLGNALKYIARAGRKDPAKTEEDLRKAIWYIDRYIAFLGKRGISDAD